MSEETENEVKETELSSKLAQIEGLLKECAKLADQTGDWFEVPLSEYTSYVSKEAATKLKNLLKTVNKYDDADDGEHMEAKKLEALEKAADDANAELDRLPHTVQKDLIDGYLEAGWQWQPSTC